MSATTDRFSQAVAGARPEMPLRAQLAACSWCPTEAATSASTAGAQADAPRCGHLSRRLADSWTLYRQHKRPRWNRDRESSERTRQDRSRKVATHGPILSPIGIKTSSCLGGELVALWRQIKSPTH